MKLKEEHKVFVVVHLARYSTPSEVVDAVSEEFGLQVSRQQVQKYDPTSRAGESLAKGLKDLFYETRRAFKKKVGELPMSHQAYRLNELHKQYVRASRAGNQPLACEILKQAAQEVGGLFTNKRTLTVGGMERAREALAQMLEEFPTVDKNQIVGMVAEDHGVDAAELASALVN